MAAPETLPEEPKPEDQKDESKVSQKHWPWIVAGLVIGIVMLWNQHIADVKQKEQTQNERIKDARDLAVAWEQVAKERRDLKISTAAVLKYTNDTAVMRRINDARLAEQSREPD